LLHIEVDWQQYHSLIAVVSNRLEGSVEGSIASNIYIAMEDFGVKLNRFPFSIENRVKARFAAAKLGKAVGKVIVRSGGSNTDLFNDGIKRGGNSYVLSLQIRAKFTIVASYALSTAIQRIRSVSEENAVPLVSQACSPLQPQYPLIRSILERVDPRTEAKDKLEGEATSILCGDTRDFRLVKLFTSIGTGNTAKKAFEVIMSKLI
jgi:hypothetical protein